MIDPKIKAKIQEQVSRLSTRELRRIVAGTRSGSKSVDSIAARAERAVQHDRARGQLFSYSRWAIVATILIALVGAYFFVTTVGLDPLHRFFTGSSDTPTGVTRADTLAESDTIVDRTLDGMVRLYLYAPPDNVVVNGEALRLHNVEGWVQLKIGKLDEVIVTRNGDTTRYLWTASGWQKVKVEGEDDDTS